MVVATRVGKFVCCSVKPVATALVERRGCEGLKLTNGGWSVLKMKGDSSVGRSMVMASVSVSADASIMSCVTVSQGGGVWGVLGVEGRLEVSSVFVWSVLVK